MHRFASAHPKHTDPTTLSVNSLDRMHAPNFRLHSLDSSFEARHEDCRATCVWCCAKATSLLCRVRRVLASHDQLAFGARSLRTILGPVWQRSGEAALQSVQAAAANRACITLCCGQQSRCQSDPRLRSNGSRGSLELAWLGLARLECGRVICSPAGSGGLARQVQAIWPTN